MQIKKKKTINKFIIFFKNYRFILITQRYDIELLLTWFVRIIIINLVEINFIKNKIGLKILST